MNNISVSNIRIRPFSDENPLEFNPRTINDDFTYRSDFILFDNLNRLGIVFEAENTAFGQPLHEPRAHCYEVQLVDDEAHELVALSYVSIRLSAWEESEYVYTELSIDPSFITVGRTYRIVVVRKGSSQELCSKNLRFLRPSKLPTKIFTPVLSCLEIGDELLRNVEKCEDQITRFTFQMDCNLPADEPIPEAMIVLYGKDGIIDQDILEMYPEKDEDWCDDPESKLYSFCFDTFMGTMFEPHDIVYAAITVLGYTVSGFVFSTNFPEYNPGMYSAEEMVAFRDYTYAEGKQWHEKVCKRKAGLSARHKLDSMVGLESVKHKLNDYTDYIRFNNLRKKAGLSTCMPPLHALFLGSPGTGKTTVAKIMGQLLKEAGVLSKGHVVVRERSSLVGKYYNSESENTLEALKEAEGGILFIDEAYNLCQPQDERDPGHFVFDTLMSTLADESKTDWMLILAGYTEPTKRLLKMNPGLSSRIPESNFYTFADYDPSELYQIAENFLTDNSYKLTPEAAVKLKYVLEMDYRNKSEDFGNGRHVMNIIKHEILQSMARRLADVEMPTTDQLTIVEAADIPAPQLIQKHKRQPLGFCI